ncbi:MAG: hypothetical protein ACPG7F_00610 [Aggregatilineales bacterium]
MSSTQRTWTMVAAVTLVLIIGRVLGYQDDTFGGLVGFWLVVIYEQLKGETK